MKTSSLLGTVFVSLLVTVFAPVESANGQFSHVWSQAQVGTGSAHPIDVTEDASGNVLVTGLFFDTMNFGGGLLTSVGGSDVFMTKFDTDGNHLWSKRFGGLDDDVPTGLAVDSVGDVFISGVFGSMLINFGGGSLTNAGSNTDDVFLAKFDTDGNHLWSQVYGGIESESMGKVAVDSAENVVFVGGFTSAGIDLGGGPLARLVESDIFVAKLDSMGNHLWSQAFGGTRSEIANTVAMDASDNVIIGGLFSSLDLDLGGGILVNRGSNDVFIGKFDPDGNYLWSQTIGGTASDTLTGVASDSSNDVLVAGFFDSGVLNLGGGTFVNSGGSDIFVGKIDSSGNHVWFRVFGDSANDFGTDVDVDTNGNVVVSGSFASSLVDFGGGPLVNHGSEDIFIAAFDTDGSHLDSRAFGSVDLERANGVATGLSGTVLLIGIISGPVDFGGGQLFNTSGEAAIIAEFTFMAPPPSTESGSSSTCFIATAAYGTPFAQKIDTLRAARDHFLIGNAMGIAFVDSYYRISPDLADIIARRPWLKAVVRTALLPVVLLSKLLLSFPPFDLAIAFAVILVASQTLRELWLRGSRI